ncbi:MAG: hypothetical protein IOD12_17070 [Silvanigrellales bacterium]|jgi:hypothetical protein|nr:hypothetical protein [Silvanigrellales bacterium]
MSSFHPHLLAALVSTWAWGGVALAQAPVPKKQATRAPKSGAGSEAKSDDFSSGAIRARRPFGFGGAYTALSDYMLAYGGEVHFNSGPWFQFGVSGLAGSENLVKEISKSDSSDVEASKFDISGAAIDVFTRFHPMKGTFSFKAGLGYRMANAEYGIRSKTTNFTLDGKLAISSVVVPVFVGNHWALDNGLFVGCDWVGAYFPLTGSSTSSLTATGAVGTTSQKEIDDLNEKFKKTGDKLAKSVSLTLLVVGVGYQF